MLRKWIELVRSVGAALLAVYRAEAEELKKEVRTSSQQLAWALGMFLAAGMLGFWTLAVGIYFVIQLVALWLPLWGAAGVVLLALVLTLLTLVGLGYRRYRRWESPVEVVRRRVADHRAWIEERLLPAEESGETAESGEERSEETER